MKARSIKAVLLAARLIFPTWSFAQTKSKDAAAYTNRGIAKLQKRLGRCYRGLRSRAAAQPETRPGICWPWQCEFFGSQLDGSAAGLQAFLRIVATKSGISPPVHLDYSFALRRKRSSRQRTRHSLQCRAGNLGI